MGFFDDLDNRCGAQSLLVPLWLFGVGLRWILWIMVAGMIQGFWRLLWFLGVIFMEWVSWISTLSCLKRRLMPYAISIVLGIAPVLMSRILVVPYLLDPVRGYMPLNYPYSPPSKIVEILLRVLFLLVVWRLGFGAIVRARSQIQCKTILPNWKKMAWGITAAMFTTYAVIVLSPVLYGLLVLIPLENIVPFYKDLAVGGCMGAAGFFWFTTYVDEMTDPVCGRNGF